MKDQNKTRKKEWNEPTKRKSIDIWKNIHSLLKINFDNFEERINYANLTKENLLKLEKAIKKIKK